MADRSRLVARWTSNHDCIGAQINDRIKRAIHEGSELSWGQIRHIKIRSVKIIASFNSHANNPNVQFRGKMNCLGD